MAPLAAQPPAKPLTVEAIFAHGPLIGTPPDELSWSPDGNHLTYLDGGELIDLDPGTGKPHVLVSRAKMMSLTASSDSERDRDHRNRYNMSSYIWSPDSTHLIFDSEGSLWLYDLRNGTGLQIGLTGAGSGDDPKFSPDGLAISFIRNHGLWVIKLRDPGAPMNAVAPSPNTATLNGEVDWVYEEELEARSNYFWSPDSKALAYLQTNEAAVPEYPIEDWIPAHAKVDLERYPQAGDPNPDVRVGVVGAGGGKTVWMKLPVQPGQDYIPRFGWADRHTLWIETLTRDQKHRSIYLADAESGQTRAVLQLSDEKYVDDNYDVWVGDGSLVLSNWSDGHNHLYLYSFDIAHPGATTAKLERQLTKGEFEVGEVYNVDFKQKHVDYASNEGNALERQLWQAGFDGVRRQLSEGDGYHAGNFAPARGGYVDRHSARMSPPTLKLCQASGKCNVFWQTRAVEPYRLRAPEELEIKAHDGTTLHATLLLPEETASGSVPPASVPLIVNPYGGPGPQTVANRWSDALLFDELLAEHGFAVLHADNRGSGMRGRDFAQAAYHDFGPVQLEDQLTVLDAALESIRNWTRSGWAGGGWSWGGSFTLYAMTTGSVSRRGSGRSGDGLAGLRLDLYGTLHEPPSEFAGGYKDFSVVNTASNLKGPAWLNLDL